MPNDEPMISQLDYPNQTSQWGKSLIDQLNVQFLYVVKLIKSVNDNIDKRFDNFKEEIDSIRATTESTKAIAEQNRIDIATIRSEVLSEVDFLKFTCEKLSSENQTLKQQTNKLENYSRRSNVIIRGIKEEENESLMSCENKARDFFKQQLQLDGNTVNDLKFVRCHRMGGTYRKQNQRTSQIRPIIVRFQNYSDKLLIWSARSKISAENMFLSENFSGDTEYNRRNLYPIFKKAKSMDKYRTQVSLNGDVLVVKSVPYTVQNLLDLPEDLQPIQFSERSNDRYLVFGGIHSVYHPLSNWYPCDIRHQGHCFKSIEQAYQYSKAVYVKDTASARSLLYTSDPRAAKDLGSKVSGLRGSTWDTKKYEIMTELVKKKFTDHPELKIALLKTENKTLVESGRDTQYAIGLPITSKDIFHEGKWTGKNMLGKILCDVRNIIRNM